MLNLLKKDFRTSISCDAIRKIMKKWNEAYIIEDDAGTNENIAWLRVAHHPCAAKGGLSKLRWGANFKLKYCLSISLYFIDLSCVVWML